VEIENIEIEETVSTRHTSQVRRTPADLLSERQAFMRRIVEDVPTVGALMRHAERYGTDQVVETAAELGYGLETCTRLMDHCDRIDAVAVRERRYSTSKKVKSSEERCKALLGITDDEEEEGKV